MKTKAFRVKDLMINVLPAHGGGSAGMPGPDQDVTDFSPHTPVVSIALQMRKLLDMRKVGLGQLTMESLNAAAINIGRVAIGSMFLCTEDMPTCEANAVISPVASFEDGLRFEDLVLAKEILAETIERIDKLEAGRLTQARTEVKELAPLLEAALKELR